MFKAVDRSVTYETAHHYWFMKLFCSFEESYMRVLIGHKYFQHPRVRHTSFHSMANWNEQKNNCSEQRNSGFWAICDKSIGQTLQWHHARQNPLEDKEDER